MQHHSLLCHTKQSIFGVSLLGALSTSSAQATEGDAKLTLKKPKAKLGLA